MIASSQKGKGEITLPFSAIKYRVKVLLFGSTRRLLYNNINLSRFSRLISRTLLKEPQIICNKTIYITQTRPCLLLLLLLHKQMVEVGRKVIERDRIAVGDGWESNKGQRRMVADSDYFLNFFSFAFY